MTTMNDAELLAAGSCRFGVSKVPLTFSGRHPMAGYSWSGKTGTIGKDTLFARALSLQDIETGERVVFCIVDLLSGSLRLLQEVHALLGQNSELANRIVLSGTHTHNAPGRYFGNPFYDRFASAPRFRAFDQRLTGDLAKSVASACQLALDSEQAGAISVHQVLLVDAGNNRSLKAFAAARRDEYAPILKWLQSPAGAGLPPSVDPRLTVIRATDTEHKARALFGWYGCHATAMGSTLREFHRDWPGVAVDRAETDACICALGAGAGGDVSPLPKHVLHREYASRAELEAEVRKHQGPGLAENIGRTVALGLLSVVGVPISRTKPLPIQVSHGLFEVQPRGSTPRWQIGAPALIGAEDGASAKIPFLDQLVAEGFSAADGPHAPKSAALGGLQAQLAGFIDVAQVHPWHIVRLGAHALFSVPGEPTVNAAAHLEHAVVGAHRTRSASVIGYAGDYAGYFTTPAEYQTQQYEGASTLYGQWSLEWYREQLLGPSRPIPRINTPVAPLAGAPLRRRVEDVSVTARELSTDEKRRISVLFALRNDATPKAVALIVGKGSIGGVLRPYPDPDASFKHGFHTYTAEFKRSAATESLTEVQLQVNIGHTNLSLPIVPAEVGERNRRLPLSCTTAPETFAWIRRRYLILALIAWALAFATQVFAREILESASGGQAHQFDVLMFRAFNLSFVLLGCNLAFTKNATDFQALEGCVLSASAFAVAQAFLFGHCLESGLGGACALVAAISLFWLSQRIKRQAPRRRPAPNYGGFALWLYGVGAITLLVGGLLLVVPQWFVPLLQDSLANDPKLVTNEDWVRAYGAGFIVNTVSMWKSGQTRDMRVVKGQFLGSCCFDTASAVFFALGVMAGFVSPKGVWVLSIFALFAALFVWLLSKARHSQSDEIRRPRTTEEVARLVREASANGQVVRVRGSGHSVPASILGWRAGGPRGKRPSERQTVHVSLEYMDQVLEVDREERLITVQAGMHLGEDPKEATSTRNNLLCHLKELYWALGDLGGVAHQTVAGFISTGSSGGSLKHSFQDSLFSIRFVDGNGQVHEAQSGTDDFNAVCVSMGLLGIITEVTFKCRERYFVRGREYAASVDLQTRTVDVRESLSCIEGGSAGVVDLTSSGGRGLAAFLRRMYTCRILWWPQAHISTMVIWEGYEEAEVPQTEVLYTPGDVKAQLAAGAALRRLGWSYGVGLRRSVGALVRRFLLPVFAKEFIPPRPKDFYAGWDVILPMDDRVDDALVPVDFTELWFPIEKTAEVMTELFEMYKDPETAGAFVVELYAARRSPAWLSPAFERDCFRVDVFWFRNNDGDPVLDYFPQFWDRLEKYAFRAHWGKYLPRPGSGQGPHYWEEQYPRWQEFHAARQRLDPHDVFFSEYWRAHLGAVAQPRVTWIRPKQQSAELAVERGQVRA